MTSDNNNNQVESLIQMFLGFYHKSEYLFTSCLDKNGLQQATERGYFTPQEDIAIKYWFAQLLHLRAGLWSIMDSVDEYFESNFDQIQSKQDWCRFTVAYASVCLLIKSNRRLIEDIASDKLVRRKLNEAATEYHIPRKQFSKLYRATSDPAYVYTIKAVRDFARQSRSDIRQLGQLQSMRPVLTILSDIESALNMDQQTYFYHLLRYRLYSMQRRWASAKQKSLFRALEVSGRVLSEISLNRPKRVTEEIIKQIQPQLKPCDVIISRHDFVASNYLLPGFWPHCALYLGDEQQQTELGIGVPEVLQNTWVGDNNTLEALKDGVRIKPLSEMLAVDNFVVIRPKINNSERKSAIEQILPHVGKKYNFDFDFFRSDRLVCTEIVYRALDNIGAMKFDLIKRAGRFTLSAEDLLDMAVENNGFTPVAIFGYQSSAEQVEFDFSIVQSLLIDSYRPVLEN